MTYKYLYQDRENRNCEGEIKARDRAEAYNLLRKQGIRPYRVIGEDPWNWRPWAIAGGYAVMLVVIVIMTIMLAAKATDNGSEPKATALSAAEAEEFRNKAEEAVYRAPEAFRYNVWKGVNARLEERGIEPLPRPEGMLEE